MISQYGLYGEGNYMLAEIPATGYTVVARRESVKPEADEVGSKCME